MSAKEGYFFRHGQTQYNADRRITGQIDIPLNDQGVREAEMAAAELPEDCTHIVCGDQQRHVQTAEILNRGRNLPIQTDARLRERSFGSLEGKHWDDADPTGEIWEADKQQKYDYRPFGGESVEDVDVRLGEGMRDWAQLEGKPAFVTSGGIIKRLKHRQAGELHESIGNASMHIFTLEAEEKTNS